MILQTKVFEMVQFPSYYRQLLHTVYALYLV